MHFERTLRQLLDTSPNAADFRDKVLTVYANELRHTKDTAPNYYPQQPSPPTVSIADELTKLSKLKEQGVISESEFQQIKQDLISRRK
jgi:putative oligomerization/nucleic acid binding protein